MNKIIILLSCSIISISAFADKYQWNPVPIYQPNLNIYQQNGNQQIQDGFNQILDSIGSNKKKTAPTNYNNVGNFTFGSDGSSYYNTDDRSYGSNGNTTYQMDENSGYSSDGSTYRRIGNNVYINNPDGTKTVCYVSSVGMQCS